MQLALTRDQANRFPLSSASLVLLVAISSIGFRPATAEADGAYIAQASGASSEQSQNVAAQSMPIAISPSVARSPRTTAFVPTPENASARSLNVAQTLEVGRDNQVAQFQSGRNNASNVGILGGSANAVGVAQGGNDLSNLYLINTKGLSVGVLQPNGAAPSNVLIARLPNGALLIKK